MIDVKKYIDELYDSEEDGAMHDACMTKITIRCTAEAAGMFNAISARFNLTRFELLEVFLNDLSTQLFISLNDNDKTEIAKNADIETTAILKKQGVIINKNDFDGSEHWRGVFMAIEKQKKYNSVEG